MKIQDIKPNPNNPRLIKDDKFKKLCQSLKDFPEMLELRPIVVNKDMIILGGNMRYKAAKEIGLKEIPVTIADLTPDQEREFLIKDNTSGGEWDWELLKNEWDIDELDAWGLDVPNFEVDEVLEAEEDELLFLFFSLGQKMEQLDRQIRLKQNREQTLQELDRLIDSLDQQGMASLPEVWSELKKQPDSMNYYHFSDHIDSLFEMVRL